MGPRGTYSNVGFETIRNHVTRDLPFAPSSRYYLTTEISSFEFR